MDNAQYEAYRINARLAGIVYDTQTSVITRSMAATRITELWGDVLLAGRRRTFTPDVVRAFEIKITQAARGVLT